MTVSHSNCKMVNRQHVEGTALLASIESSVLPAMLQCFTLVVSLSYCWQYHQSLASANDMNVDDILRGSTYDCHDMADPLKLLILVLKDYKKLII